MKEDNHFSRNIKGMKEVWKERRRYGREKVCCERGRFHRNKGGGL
jgi:hypothetical protein